MTLIARPMTAEDVPACVDIINHIIGLGGTTAYEEPYTVDALKAHYLEEADISNVVEDNGRIAGFQAVFAQDNPTEYSVGSFTDQKAPVKGAGAVLMAKMKEDCRAAGGTSIVAKITSDNTGGLAFYSKMGFLDETIQKNAFTRKDGTTVDRVIKRFVL